MLTANKLDKTLPGARTTLGRPALADLRPTFDGWGPRL